MSRLGLKKGWNETKWRRFENGKVKYLTFWDGKSKQCQYVPAVVFENATPNEQRIEITRARDRLKQLVAEQGIKI